MESAIFGLIGVALGALLTVAREWWFQSRKNRKDAEYLAIQISCELERYASNCADVVADDGLCQGQPDEEGYCHIQVETPKFEPMLINVEWKSLPANLMYEILDFPYKAEKANQLISSVFSYQADPPDYWQGFEERQFQYAKLGIEALRLSVKLRKYAELPDRVCEAWSPLCDLEEKKSTIELKRANREAQYSISTP